MGPNAERRSGLVLSAQDGFVAAALTTAEPVVSADIERDARTGEGESQWAGLGPVVAVPLGAGGKARGVLLLGWLAGRTPFSESDIGPLLGFAGQAALALELAERRRDAEQIALLQDRDRIARDLHDLAIQRLFAAGMTLQSTQRFVDHPEAVKACATSLGFAPALRVEGLVDTDVPGEVADHALAVLGEALSNAARHSGAHSVDVHLQCARGELALTVTDDGCGRSCGPWRGWTARARSSRPGRRRWPWRTAESP
ncbi:GAF domain-containing sensor histidine kinase [Streptomyces sp. GLT-R25]